LRTDLTILLDTDFVSSFAWVNRMDILEGLYSGRMMVLEEVMIELERVRSLADLVCFSIMHGHIKRKGMMAGSAEALEYARLHDRNQYGSGEAACMAYAYCRGGIVASNNLKDVKRYCDERQIPLLTTADVLLQEYQEGRLRLEHVDLTWQHMVQKRNRLPTGTFTEYLKLLGERV